MEEKGREAYRQRGERGEREGERRAWVNTTEKRAEALLFRRARKVGGLLSRTAHAILSTTTSIVVVVVVVGDNAYSPLKLRVPGAFYVIWLMCRAI